MRALTVQQPWAWAIMHGGKDVENRTQAWGYRGPLAIHAGQREDLSALDDPTMWAALFPPGEVRPLADPKPLDTRGAVLGVVDLVDVHRADGLEADPWEWCCKPWGRGPGITLKADGTFTGPTTHLVLANPRPLATAIPAKGRLGLWTPDAELLAQIREQVPA